MWFVVKFFIPNLHLPKSQGAYTGVCSQQHVPSYKNNIDKFKAKGIDSVICVSVNDPYTLNAWAEKLQAKDAVSVWSESRLNGIILCSLAFSFNMLEQLGFLNILRCLHYAKDCHK